MDWVIMLNRAKEARMQIGGVKLVNHELPPSIVVRGGTDALLNSEVTYNNNMPLTATNREKRTESDEYYQPPYIVVEAQRERTRAIGKDNFDPKMQEILLNGRSDLENIPHPEPIITNQNSMMSTISTHSPVSISHLTSMHIPTIHRATRAFARWEKNRSGFEKWTMRLSRWARRMTMLRCVVQDNVWHRPHGLDTEVSC